MVIEAAKAVQSRRGLPLFSLHRTGQQHNTQDELSDKGDGLRSDPEVMHISRSGLETAFLKLTTIERELYELKRIILDYDSRKYEKVPLTLLQTDVLEALAEKKMTAGEVARIVNRTRPLLVINLHQMVALGLLEEERQGMRVYFKKRGTATLAQRNQE